jgi:hypothetical protein
MKRPQHGYLQEQLLQLGTLLLYPLYPPLLLYLENVS